MEANNKSRPRRMDFDTAMAFAVEEFERLHPRESWPEWLSRCTVWSGTPDGRKRWVMSLAATPNEPLGPDEFWEEIEGRKYLVRVDPATSKKWVILDRAPREVITIFETAVDSETGAVTVLTDTDPSSLTGEDLQGF